jgi:hypothetical protein
MTLGDIIGGVVNIVVDIAVSFGLSKLGDAVGGKVASEIGKQAISVALPALAAVGKVVGINLDTSIDNPGQPVQQWIDGDGVGSDARPGVRVVGFGGQGTGSKGGPTSGATPVAPWSK